MSEFAIKQPWITEKSTRLAEQGKYVFKVAPTTTKNEVKKAVKEIYKVDVVKVNITTKPDRTVRFRGREVAKKGFKKAVVTLKSGQKIDLA
jgi:large subunit ribosomal protein L23